MNLNGNYFVIFFKIKSGFINEGVKNNFLIKRKVNHFFIDFKF
jgi:hypothetical protein